MRLFLGLLGVVFVAEIAALGAYPADRKETLLAMAVTLAFGGIIRWIGSK